MCVCIGMPNFAHHIMTGEPSERPEMSTSFSPSEKNAAVPSVMLTSVSVRRSMDGAMVWYRTCHIHHTKMLPQFGGDCLFRV